MNAVCLFQLAEYRYLAYYTQTNLDYVSAADLSGSLLTGQEPTVTNKATGTPGVMTRGVSSDWGPPNNGDKVRIPNLSANFGNQSGRLPGGVSFNTWYWVYNVSGQDFSLSSTDPAIGTTPVTFTTLGNGTAYKCSLATNRVPGSALR